MAGLAKLKQSMTIKIDDVMTDQRAMRFGLLIIIALMWLPGCAGRTGSATVPAAILIFRYTQMSDIVGSRSVELADFAAMYLRC